MRRSRNPLLGNANPRVNRNTSPAPTGYAGFVGGSLGLLTARKAPNIQVRNRSYGNRSPTPSE
jgi:hypothetical protein